MANHTASTVLIVEDDPGVATLERRRLERSGYAVLTAASAAEALEQLERAPIDLILLDYRLPGDVDGLAFYSRARDFGYQVPVILVTGFGNEAVVIQALRSGVRDFVSKSVEYLDYLPEAVGRVLRQVETERRLAESEARLAAIVGSANDAILIVEVDGRISLLNRAAEAMFRCRAANAVGQPFARYLPGDLPPGVLSGVGVRADGAEFPAEPTVAVVSQPGRTSYAIVVRDATERRRAERRIREQASLLDEARDAIILRGLDGRVLYWNRGAERLYGWTAEEAVGRGPEGLPREAPGGGSEVTQVTRAGKEIVVESRQTVLVDEAGRPRARLTIDTDITDKKALEARVLQAQRMESVGLLAGGIAHDFNNLLTVICGFSEIALASQGLPEQTRGMLDLIHDAGERAAVLTRQLLAFSRKQVLQPVPLDLNALLIEAQKLLGRLIGANVDLACRPAPGLDLVRADPGQIEQVIINLAVNARDAMPDGGHLTIETRNVALDDNACRTHPDARPGPYVLLAVTDSGVGIDEATKLRIFEPFFTTKPVGKGTGLGLATVYGIVKQSGGFIHVYSEPGNGTSFKVYLPRLEGGVGHGPRPSSVFMPPPTGTETVLIAEDQEGVLQLARQTLESLGYRVLTAGDGNQALKAAAAHDGPLALLVTDMVMPGMGGRQLSERMAEARPGLKVLYLSGYTDDAVIRHGQLPPGAAFLQKPFTPATLARKVREVLDGV